MGGRPAAPAQKAEPGKPLYVRKTPPRAKPTIEKRFAEGERKLLFAVLEDAIRCYLRDRDRAEARNNEDFVEAVEWLSCDEECGPFSYVSVCEALGIDADCLRAGISDHTGRLEEVRT